MCLDLIADLLGRLDDRLIVEIDAASDRIRKSLPGGSEESLDALEELHRERARQMTGLALRAGVAVGKTLAALDPDGPE